MSVSLIGMIIALGLLMFLVFKRVNIFIAALVSALVVILTSGLPVLETLTVDFSEGFAGFIASNILLFTLSALFGKIMDDSGAASAFAKFLYNISGKSFAPFTCMIATALLAYGGVSNFVIVFAVYPIFLRVWREVNLPARFIPGAIYGSAATFAASMLPGTPQLNNIIPISYLGTSPTSAPLIGIVTAIFTMLIIYFYFKWEFKRARKRNEGFKSNKQIQERLNLESSNREVNPYLAMLPMIVLVVTLNLFGWHIVLALTTAILLTIVLFWKNLSEKLSTINEGISSAVSAIFNTSAAVGFGSVVRLTSGFNQMVNGLMSIGGHPVLSLGIIATIISGITGSGTGGLGIVMEVFTEPYLELGVHPELFHRVVTIASNGLDSLPHNGLVITIITACGMTHKESYKQIFVTSILTTLAALAITIVMGIAIYPVNPM